MSADFIELNALGRECYLGQLYDARTSTLLPGSSLYKTGDIKPRRTAVNSTRFKYTEVRSFSDRAKSIDISAQLSATVLAGLVSVSGSGSYMNNRRDTNDSMSIAMISQYRTQSQSLDLVELEGKMATSADLLAKVGATHVVTSITYGGNIIGTLTQKSVQGEATDEVEGSFDFSIETLKRLGKALSVENRVELRSHEKAIFNDRNLEVDLVADVRLEDHDIPTDPVSMFEFVRKSSSLVGDGVSCEIRLSPLIVLFPDVPTFRELAEADLVEIIHAYDDILKLENSRAWLRDAVVVHAKLFSSFAAAVRTRTADVTKLVQRARSRLRVHLQMYRSASTAETTEGSGLESAGKFVGAINQEFAIAMSKYAEDEDLWRMYQDRLAAAKQHGFPATSISAISSKMNRANEAMLVAVLVPENSDWEALVNLYSNLAVDVRQWRQSVDKPLGRDDDERSKTGTEYVSIYSDPAHDAMLYSLDDNAGTLKDALKTARGTKEAIFVTYGRSRGHVGRFVWNVLNKEGWGVIVHKAESWRYIGDVHLSRPHGDGVMTYTNRTKYVGSFAHGQRDGEGKVLDEEGKELPGMSGVFIKNVFKPHGVMVEVTVLNKDGVTVQYGTVALSKFDSVRTHVRRIATVMDWEETRRFRLVLNDRAAQVDVVGGMIDPSESPTTATSYWTFKEAPQIVAHGR